MECSTWPGSPNDTAPGTARGGCSTERSRPRAAEIGAVEEVREGLRPLLAASIDGAEGVELLGGEALRVDRRGHRRDDRSSFSCRSVDLDGAVAVAGLQHLGLRGHVEQRVVRLDRSDRRPHHQHRPAAPAGPEVVGQVLPQGVANLFELLAAAVDVGGRDHRHRLHPDLAVGVERGDRVRGPGASELVLRRGAQPDLGGHEAHPRHHLRAAAAKQDGDHHRHQREPTTMRCGQHGLQAPRREDESPRRGLERRNDTVSRGTGPDRYRRRRSRRTSAGDRPSTPPAGFRCARAVRSAASERSLRPPHRRTFVRPRLRSPE